MPLHRYWYRPLPSLNFGLEQCVRQSVRTHSGRQYSGCYPTIGELMVFATQGSHGPTFTAIVGQTARPPKHFGAYNANRCARLQKVERRDNLWTSNAVIMLLG